MSEHPPIPTLPPDTGFDPAGMVVRRAHDREMDHWRTCPCEHDPDCERCGGQGMYRPMGPRTEPGDPFAVFDKGRMRR